MDKWEDTVMSKAEIREALVKAGCPEDLIKKMGSDLSLWWKAGWIQEILLAQKKAGEDKGKQEGFDKVVEFIENHSFDKRSAYYGLIFYVKTEEWQAFLKERGK